MTAQRRRAGDEGQGMARFSVPAVLREWGPASSIFLSVAMFIATTRELPGRVTRLETVAQTLAMVDAEKAKTDAVQDERLQNMLTLLKDIRDELRAIRQQGE